MNCPLPPETTGDAAVKVDVVNEEHLALGECGKHPGNLVGQSRELFWRRALSRQASCPDFQDAAGLVHLLAGEAMQSSEEAERFGSQRRWSIGNIGPRPVLRMDDAESGE